MRDSHSGCIATYLAELEETLFSLNAKFAFWACRHMSGADRSQDMGRVSRPITTSIKKITVFQESLSDSFFSVELYVQSFKNLEKLQASSSLSPSSLKNSSSKWPQRSSLWLLPRELSLQRFRWEVSQCKRPPFQVIRPNWFSPLKNSKSYLNS